MSAGEYFDTFKLGPCRKRLRERPWDWRALGMVREGHWGPARAARIPLIAGESAPHPTPQRLPDPPQWAPSVLTPEKLPAVKG